MNRKKIQVKHLSDKLMLDTIEAEQKHIAAEEVRYFRSRCFTTEQITRYQKPLHEVWTFRWNLYKRLPQFPPKVIDAKLEQLVNRGVLDGCTCGCRGDFSILEDIRENLEAEV